MFSPLVQSTWLPEGVGVPPAERIVVRVDHALPPNRSVSLLRLEEGGSFLLISPDRARELVLAHGDALDAAELSARLAEDGITLNTPDLLFYLTIAEQAALLEETHAPGTRRLTAEDAVAFQEFTDAAPDDDLDEAFVELDHWLVVGTFLRGQLVSAASMYPWSGTHLADLGVITLPEFRGRGLGRATVRAISAQALELGYEPQYRCQLDNDASVALARPSGLTPLGEWEVIEDAE